jgi:tetratricopeptide (TPR) repeat protein
MGNCLCFKSRGGPTEVVASSEEYKLFGNQLFKQQKYEEAAVQYSKAIKINNKVSVYFSNRALCYYKLKKYHQAFEDGNSGYVIDNNNLKALILCIKSKASEALQGNLENFEHSLKYCEFFNYSSMADSNKEYCESLTRKIKSLFKFVEAKEKKTKLIQYYSKILPKDTYTKLIQLFSNESEQMESCICPLTMVL